MTEHDEGLRSWQSDTAKETDEQKLLRWVRWSVGLSRQGEDGGSVWNLAGEEILPIAKRLLGGEE
jgi:hypothetical protein